jgi:hypothetical protein
MCPGADAMTKHALRILVIGAGMKGRMLDVVCVDGYADEG